MVKLPCHNWFIQQEDKKYLTNVFCGSLGTDPKTGCLNRDSFNYKAYVKVLDDEGPVSFCVEYYWQEPLGSCDTESVIRKEFENSKDGILQAEEWILAQFNAGRNP